MACTRARRTVVQSIDLSNYSSNSEDPPSSPGTSSKATSSERLEMPPPPSPASSTCSEPGCSPLPKRKYRHLSSPKDEDKSPDEEQWNLRDVVFLDDVRNLSVAKVVKLDGVTALVRFNQRDPFGQTDSDVNAYLQDCRMLRKDELQVVKGTSSSRVFDCQRSPKKINISDDSHILCISVSNNGIHAVVRNGNKLEYKIYHITSGKASKTLNFVTDTYAFLGRDPSQIALYTSGETDVAVLLRDGNGTIYPLAKDCLDSLKEPISLDMSPVQSMAMGIHSVKIKGSDGRNHPALVIAMALEDQILTPAIIRSDPEYVRLTLASLEKETVSQLVVTGERIDGNRNILHTAVSVCVPTSNRLSNNSSETRHDLPDQRGYQQPAASLHEAIKRSKALHKQASDTAINTLESSAIGANNLWSNETINVPTDFIVDPSEQKQSAHSVLWALVESHVLKSFMKDLMVQRDAQGMTPFMAAVAGRAYSAGIILLNVAQSVAERCATDNESKKKLLMSMIFPRGTNLDNNPIHMLCCNDTCSFTWTGAQHINQDIYECKTCGLTRTLCCCSECARVCHKGHECRLKRTSPTAYCDCWEKCKCKALVAGSQTARYQLLVRLLSDTDLVIYPNSRGENILLFLAQTVGRQIIEQKQYGSSRQLAGSSLRKSANDVRGDDDVPDHDLEPPRFSRKSLDKLLGEWPAVKSMIITGTGTAQSLSSKFNPYLTTEDQALLASQTGTALLDRFTHCLLVKIGQEMLDVLLTTIIREASGANNSHVVETRTVARRFVRSVARVGVVLSVELAPMNYSNQLSSVTGMPYSLGHSNTSITSSLWKKSQPTSILHKCRKVFQALLPIAAEELAEIADALISPVRLGVPRPTAPFSLFNSIAEATQGSEELFSVDPIVVPSPASGGVDGDDGGENPNIYAPSQIAQNLGFSARPPIYDANIADAADSEDPDGDASAFRPDGHDDSDSESDSNADDASFHSNVEHHAGSHRTGTSIQAGSDVGAPIAYFSEPDSNDSSNAEDEDESEPNDSDDDPDDITFVGEELGIDRRNLMSHSNMPRAHSSGYHSSAGSSNNRPNLAQHLQWALRQRDHAGPSAVASIYENHSSGSSSLPQAAARLASIGLSNVSNYTYMDGSSRRIAGHSAGSGSHLSSLSSVNTNEGLSMATTAVGLSRAFSIIIRSISDLIPLLKELERSDTALSINQLKVTPNDAALIIVNLERKLKPVWDWLFKVMDSTEGQLRFGCALTNGSQKSSSSVATSNSQPPSYSRTAPGANLITNPLHIGAGGSSAPGGGPPPLQPSMILPRMPQPGANISLGPIGRRVPPPNLLDETSRINSASVVDQNVGIRSSGGAPASSSSSNQSNPPHQSASMNIRPQSSATIERIPRPGGGGTSYLRGTANTDPSELADGTAARRDFLSYMISLIRGHGNEHCDSLPILDVSSLRHVAYVFDAYIYYLQSLHKGDASKMPSHSTYNDRWEDEENGQDTPISLIQNDQSAMTVDDDSATQIHQNLNSTRDKGAKHQFFRRSESTLFIGCQPPDPFALPISEALPLAKQPHLLQPTSRREELFGPLRATACMTPNDVFFDSLPNRLSLNSRSIGHDIPETPSTSSLHSHPFCVTCHAALQEQASTVGAVDNSPGPSYRSTGSQSAPGSRFFCSIHQPMSSTSGDIHHTTLLGRWRLTLELFGREFVDDVGAEPGSIISDLVGFPLKESRFRKDMERLRTATPREITFTSIDRDRNTLIQQTLKELNGSFNNFSRKNTTDLPTLAVSKIKVSFKDEAGEGNGVVRSFYTAFCEAILSNERLPSLEPCQGTSRPPQYTSSQREEEDGDNAPMFYQPGIRNFYSLRQGRGTTERLNAFRNVGRIIGICLTQSEICPIQLNRHVVKYMLGRPISWHDLAFFDPMLYESLRQLILDAETNRDSEATFQALDLRFCVDLCIEEGGGQVTLMPGGRNVEVTPTNIYEYVRRYALLRMVKSQEKALQALRQGVLDAVPACALESLSPEDFRLLLNGVGEINVQTLMSYTSFIDDRGKQRNTGESSEHLAYFKKWFWSIVEKMATKERQDLVYFWTGSPSLPASEEGFQPMPTVSIRPADDRYLPTSNVCIFRLYIPLYSSKAILKSKLLIAIKEKNFGFI